MPDLSTADLRTFIPAKDFNRTKAFYRRLGWPVKDVAPNLALVEVGERHFYLQDYYIEMVAHNTMLHISVADAQAWYEHVAAVLEDPSFADARVQRPVRQDYGALVTFVHDPAGVLLHLCQWDR